MKQEPFFVPCDKLRNISVSPVLCKDEPLGAGALASIFLENLLSQEQKDMMILNNNKTQILPKKLQEKVNISALSREMLILKTSSSVWKAETLAIKKNIIANCNRILGRIAVKNIRFG